MAVYTEISDDELAAFLAQYELGELLSCKGIAEGVENSNFLLATAQGNFILTLYEKRVDPADLPYFLGLMEHLAARGLPCPTPIHGQDGVALRTLAGKPAAIVTFLPGLWPRTVRVGHCAPLGEALARLHEAGADFAPRRANALGPSGWRPLFERSRARADSVREGLAEEVGSALDAVLAAWPGGLPQGHIHGDLFPDNVFFRAEAVSGLIDFYFACTDALAYDIAVCLNAWCFEPDGSFNVTKSRALLAGYQRRRALAPAEKAALPTLAAGAALRFLLTRLFDWLHHDPAAFVTPKDPLEYLRKLRFHRAARGPGDYGLD
ncbi:MAG: homoserine kinase [Alphaproteobacteria bacterium]|nr:homoserine kinase [Alphaproteobacteria bacterium]